MKEASNSVQHEQCCSDEATIHLAGELHPPPATTDDRDLRVPVTLCSGLHALFFNTQAQNRHNLLELTLVLKSYFLGIPYTMERPYVEPETSVCPLVCDLGSTSKRFVEFL